MASDLVVLKLVLITLMRGGKRRWKEEGERREEVVRDRLKGEE